MSPVQRRAATERVEVKIDGVNTVVAEPGQPVPLAYEHLVSDDQAVPMDPVASRSTTGRRASADAVSTPTGDEDLSKLKREDLDERARAAGVDEPEKLSSKQDVIDAIEAAGQ